MNFQIDFLKNTCYNQYVLNLFLKALTPAVCVNIGFILTNTSNTGDLRPAVACRPSIEEGNPGAAGKSPTCTRRFRIVRHNGTAGIHSFCILNFGVKFINIRFLLKEKRMYEMKKLVSILVAGALLMFACTGALAAFPDMPAGEDGAVLQRAVDNGLISGFDDGTVQPHTPITRAQMATIMSRAMNATKAADLSAFVDVKAGDWYYDAMAKAVAMKAFKGDDKAQLNPNNTISRQEAMIVLSRIFCMPKADASALNGFSDANTVASWAVAEVSKVAAGGYLEGVTALRAAEPMTRLEFAQIMDKIVKQYIDEDGEYTEVTGHVLVRAQNVKFTGVKGNFNIYVGDGVEGTVEFVDSAAKRVVARGGVFTCSPGSTYESMHGEGGIVVAPRMDIDIQ